MVNYSTPITPNREPISPDISDHNNKKIKSSEQLETTHHQLLKPKNGVSCLTLNQQSNNSLSNSSLWKIGRAYIDDDCNGNFALINRRLPKELLLRIFSHLDVVSLCRCAKVSRAWNVLALDGSNWQDIDLFQFQLDVQDEVVENIARRCGGFLRKLSLRGCQAVDDAALDIFAQNCRNIESLNLKFCRRITDRTAESLAKHCYNLRLLDLNSCPSVTNASLTSLASGCPGLTHIDISWCENISDAGVKTLAEGCKSLKSFVARGCTTLRCASLCHLARNCTHLSRINLQGCRSIMDEGIVRLVSSSGIYLTYICISNCPLLTDATLLALAQHCPSLITLECASVVQLTDVGFSALAKNCRCISRLDLEECILLSDSSLSALASGCPSLESLSLSHCELITDEGIRQIGIAHCAPEDLVVLELDNLPLITDSALDHLVACHNLQRIELYDCQLITRAGIRRLRNHLPNIKVHAYFAPVTPPISVGGTRHRFCRCCIII